MKKADRRNQVLRAIHRLTKPYPPTLEEVGEALGGLSKARVHQLCEPLKALGLLKSRDGRPGVVLTDAGLKEIGK